MTGQLLNFNDTVDAQRLATYRRHNAGRTTADDDNVEDLVSMSGNHCKQP